LLKVIAYRYVIICVITDIKKNIFFKVSVTDVLKYTISFFILFSEK